MKNLYFIGGGLDECETYTDGKSVYRAIPKVSINQRWRHVPKFLNSDKYLELVEKRLISKFVKTDINPDDFPCYFGQERARNRIIYKSEYNPFTLFYQKCGKIWTNIHHVEFLKACSKINIILWPMMCQEPCFGNFSFAGSRPLLVDIGSVGVQKGSAYGLIKETLLRQYVGTEFEKLLKNLQPDKLESWEELSKLCNISENDNIWDDYNKRPLPIPHKPIYDKETNWLKMNISKLDIKTILDVGGNDGYNSFALESYNTKICCIDNSKNAITKGFLHAKKHDSSVTFYDINLTEDLEPLRKVVTKEVIYWTDRLESDCIIVSSVMHHLCRQNKDFKWQVDLYNKLSRRYIFIEYIDKEDPHVKNWSQNWSLQGFLDAFSQDWNIIEKFKDYAGNEDSKPHRTWYAFERKNPKEFKFWLSQIL